MHKTPDSLDGHFTSGLIMQQMIMLSVIITAKPMSYNTGKNNAPVTVTLKTHTRNYYYMHHSLIGGREKEESSSRACLTSFSHTPIIITGLGELTRIKRKSFLYTTGTAKQVRAYQIDIII